MSKIVIAGLGTIDGEYEFDFKANPFTNREWRIVKDVSGIRMGEFEAAIDAGDNDLLVALTMIELRRRRIDVNVETLWEATTGQIVFVGETADDAGPPAGSAPEKNDDGARSKTRSGANGDAGPVTTPAAIGVPA